MYLFYNEKFMQGKFLDFFHIVTQVVSVEMLRIDLVSLNYPQNLV